MALVKNTIFLFLIFSLFTPLNISYAETEVNAVKEVSKNSVTEYVSGVSKIFEDFRLETLAKIKARQSRTQNLILAPNTNLDEDVESSEDEEEAPAPQSDPWHDFLDTLKYLEMFLLSLLVLVFSVKTLFYGIAVFLLFIISRFIWYRFY